MNQFNRNLYLRQYIYPYRCKIHSAWISRLI